MKLLLAVTAMLETATGLVLMVSPSVLVFVLLGSVLDGPDGIVIDRVAGAALLALGTACWLARGVGAGGAARGLVAAMLVYNIAVAAVLVHACVGPGLSGVGLWPGVVLHLALAVWCVACLRPTNLMIADA